MFPLRTFNKKKFKTIIKWLKFFSIFMFWQYYGMDYQTFSEKEFVRFKMMQNHWYQKCNLFYRIILNAQMTKPKKPSKKEEIFLTVYSVRCMYALCFILCSFSISVSLPFWESPQQPLSSQQATWQVKIAAEKAITNSTPDKASNIIVKIRPLSFS